MSHFRRYVCEPFVRWGWRVLAVRLAFYRDLARKKFVDIVFAHLERLYVCVVVRVKRDEIVHDQSVDVFGDFRGEEFRECVEENPVADIVQQQLPMRCPIAIALQFARVVVVPHDDNPDSLAHATMKRAPMIT